MSTHGWTEPIELPSRATLKPARFKITAPRFLRPSTPQLMPGEVGTVIDVTLSPDARREGWDDWVGVFFEGTQIGWVSTEGEQTRAQLRAIRDHGFEVVASSDFEDFQGVRSLRVQVPKPAALTSWLEWRRPAF
jgi:hypothetical protein